MKIGIVGLGLIGGSLAKSIKNRTGHVVLGADTDKETMFFADMSGAIDGELQEAELSSCDILFLGLVPHAAVSWLNEHAASIASNCIVIDLCGVKRCLWKKFHQTAKHYGFIYIGGHPMAGKERGGFKNASAELFDAASMILTPDEDTEPEVLEKLDNLFTDIGFARVVYASPDEHDRIIAYTSQLAHIVSSSYVKSSTALKHRGFSAGSFRDMTRVAYLDESMWTELFLENRDYLSAELDCLIARLNEYRDALAQKDEKALAALLKAGKDMKVRAGGN